MDELGVPVNDLYGILMGQGAEGLMREDGTHFTQEGSAALAGAVVVAVERVGGLGFGARAGDGKAELIREGARR